MFDSAKWRDGLVCIALVAGMAAFTGCASRAGGNDTDPAPPAPEADSTTPLPAGPASSQTGASPAAADPPPVVPTAKPLALVYRGPVVGCDGCSESLAAVLQKSKWNLDVRFVGPAEDLKLTAATLQTAAVYAQPGGDGQVDAADKLVEAELGAPNVIADWVRAGGRYYGACMGGYLAGRNPGYGLLPGDTDQWIASHGASVKNDKDTLVKMQWKGTTRSVYFQDGPYFVLDKGSDATVLATYQSNGLPAVVVAPLGKGRVAVTGPHLEADQSWFDGEKLTDPDDPDGSKGHALDLANELVDTLMTP